MSSNTYPRRIWDVQPKQSAHTPPKTTPQPLDAWPPAFGTENLRTRWHSACRRAENGSRYRYSVAPGCILHALDGRRLTEGECVVPADVGGLGVVVQLVRRRVVIENSSAPVDDSPDLPPAA